MLWEVDMWRALGFVLTGVVLIVLALIGGTVLDDRGAAFEARGARVSGAVVEVHRGIRGLLTADVRYRVAGAERTGLIQLDHTYSDVKQGDQVTVIYDPSDPDEVAAPGIPDNPEWSVYVMAVLVIGGLSTFVLGVVRLLLLAFPPRRRGRVRD